MEVEISIDKVISILDYFIYRIESTYSKKLLQKEYSYDIEYISPIKFTTVNKNIYIFTDNVEKNNILDFFIKLLNIIYKKYSGNIKTYTVEHNNMGSTEYINNKKEISLVRSNNLTLFNILEFEIWIYIDKNIPDNNSSDIIAYRLIIMNSNNVDLSIINNMSTIIYV